MSSFEAEYAALSGMTPERRDGGSTISVVLVVALVVALVAALAVAATYAEVASPADCAVDGPVVRCGATTYRIESISSVKPALHFNGAVLVYVCGASAKCREQSLTPDGLRVLRGAMGGES